MNIISTLAYDRVALISIFNLAVAGIAYEAKFTI